MVLVRLGARAGTPEADRKLAAVRSEIEDFDVAAIGEPEPGSPLVSKDGRSAYLPVTFYTAADEDAAAEALVERLRGEPGVTVGGGIVAFNQVGDQVEADLQRAELIAAPILLLFSLLVFRSLVAALLPLAVGTATVLLTFSGLRLINSFEPMSTFAINLTTGLGLGLAIDYSLFMVSRFREELEHDGERSRALRATVVTAGRTVLFSAFTVAAALAAMLVFPLRFLYSMGAGGVLVALSAALVSLTLLPALLAVLGPRVNALGLRRWQVAMHRDAAHVRSGPWYRLSRAVMRRPGPVAAFAATLLIVMGLPFLRIEFTGVDASVLPAQQSAKAVDEALRAEFPPGPTTPLLVVAGVGERGRPGAEDYGRRLAAVDGVASVSPPEQAGGYWLYSVVTEAPALSGPAKEVVRDVRALDVPFPVEVGGETAGFLDQQRSLGDSLPLALAIIATTTLVILFAMTGSVVLPVKALVMNLLTVSAAFGLLVLIFQDGRLESLLAYDSQGALGGDPARVAVLRRLRPLDRLRRLPAHAHQGGARRRHGRARVGRRRARADGPDRDLRGAAVLRRDRRVRDVGGRVHQGGRRRDGARGADRRVHRARAAGAVADGVAGPLELVGAAAAGAAARAAGAAARVTLRADTELSRNGDGRFRGEVSEAWWIERGPFGGYLSAFLVRAMMEVLDDPARPPRSLTVHFVDAPAAGPIDVAVTVERAGRSSTALSLRLEQDGRPIALALAGAAAWREGEPEWADLRAPAAPAPEDCPELPRVKGAPRFQERFDLRWVEGGAPGRPAERARHLAVDAPEARAARSTISR